MVVGPISPVVQAAIEQPPPKKTVVRIVVRDPGSIIIRTINVINSRGPRSNYGHIRNINVAAGIIRAAVPAREGGRAA
jgi:hypothetical protein